MPATATLIDRGNASIGGSYADHTYAIQVDNDAINTRFSIHTPQANNRLYVVGLLVSEANAPNVIFTSRSRNLVGTVSLANGSDVITGAGTLFQKDFLNGGRPIQIEVGGGAGQVLTIASVTNNTTMVGATNASADLNEANYKRITSRTFELTAHQGIWNGLGLGYAFKTRPGEELLFQASAAISYLELVVVEARDGLSLRR